MPTPYPLNPQVQPPMMMMPTNGPPPPQCSSKVELHISCRNLKNMDVLSKSDPRVLVYIGYPQNHPQFTWKLLGETETVRDNLNPNFVKSFVLDYFFEEVQHLKFAVYDIDNSTATLNDDDFIGEMTTTLGEICGSRGQKLIKHLCVGHSKTSRGTIIVSAEQINSNVTDDVEIQLAGISLAKMDFFGKSDPFFIIEKLHNGQYINVFQSETIMNTLNPVWKPFRMPLTKLCNGDVMRPLKISVYDYDKFSQPDFIGECETNLDSIMKGTLSLKLINKNKKKGKEHTGDLVAKSAKLVKNYSFLDFISGGLRMNLLVAIDFTASNGNVTDPHSLHYNKPGQMNQYESAIYAVGQILSDYDYDKKFPCFGYGGYINGSTSHCFALNGNPQQPECYGVEGILQAYRQALNNVSLSGPTLFANVIKTACQIASQPISQQNQEYYILLIITDGAINDMDSTIEEIVRGSELPLSIIIVGVGNADFKSMVTLDGDDGRLRSPYTFKYASRDIVQFVPFNQFKNQPYTYLAKEVLAEIPQQVTEFMKMRNIVPNPRVVVAEYVPPMSEELPRGSLSENYNPNLATPPSSSSAISAVTTTTAVTSTQPYPTNVQYKI
ncbi:hypothetical protein C9374_002974 [Naegleria lovaniensis]|uniref:Copine n=1 Tax=Naegleria lovaniensis TaxID=51637 RepID=A0AA88KJN5_NAELO|nr:uncharacterized protein C9374_002974 [Naegleria lovaniensis]KAG2385825.1 hypothetical protein C9374_002974 [Naegleria lovaniensis]